jgi:hypothetical protein
MTLFLKMEFKMGVEVYICNPSIGRLRQKD